MDLPPRKTDAITSPEIERLLYQTGVVKMDARGLTNGLSEEQFRWRPAPEAWSVADCFEHLNQINRLWLPRLEEGIERGHAQGLRSPGPFVYGWFSRWLLAQTEPPPKRRVRAPARLRPAGKQSGEEIMAEFVALHERLERALRRADGLNLARLRVPSPVAPWLRFSLGISFWMLLAHDRRHIYQARELRKLPAFPPARVERTA